MRKKKIDCIAMQRRGATEVYSLVKSMTRDEELSFW